MNNKMNKTGKKLANFVLSCTAKPLSYLLKNNWVMEPANRKVFFLKTNLRQNDS